MEEKIKLIEEKSYFLTASFFFYNNIQENEKRVKFSKILVIIVKSYYTRD